MAYTRGDRRGDCRGGRRGDDCRDDRSDSPYNAYGNGPSVYSQQTRLMILQCFLIVSRQTRTSADDDWKAGSTIL